MPIKAQIEVLTRIHSFRSKMASYPWIQWDTRRVSGYQSTDTFKSICLHLSWPTMWAAVSYHLS